MTYAKSCLLIDDDHDDQLLFSIILEKVDKSILCVSVDNGVEAIRVLEHDLPRVPDLIFLDLNIPGSNGMDCLIKIKGIAALSLIPVVIYSTSSRNADIMKAKALGAVAFITKSYHVRDLTRKLNALFLTHFDV